MSRGTKSSSVILTSLYWTLRASAFPLKYSSFASFKSSIALSKSYLGRVFFIKKSGMSKKRKNLTFSLHSLQIYSMMPSRVLFSSLCLRIYRSNASDNCPISIIWQSGIEHKKLLVIHSSFWFSLHFAIMSSNSCLDALIKLFSRLMSLRYLSNVLFTICSFSRILSSFF